MKPIYWNKGRSFLSNKDKILKNIIDTYPKEYLIINENYFHALLNSIIGQQISVSAANAIKNRFFNLAKNLTPKKVLKLKDISLRECGLSRQKILYIYNISSFFIENKNFIINLKKYNEKEIKDKLISIKGVGNWTADMFLLFSYGSSNIFPIGDLGFIKAISKAYNRELPLNDAYLKIYPISGYGNPDILRQILKLEKPDAIMHFTDPRFWSWLYNMEHEIRQNIPIMYYNIWDDIPDPLYNTNFYRSSDMLMSISKQTYGINKRILSKYNYEDWQTRYVPHGITDKRIFKIEDKGDTKFKEFEQKQGLDKYKFKNDFEILSVIRNMKIIGIFTRLATRDKKPRYLNLIPYAWKLIELRIRNNKKFNELKDILDFNFSTKMRKLK